MNTRRRLLLAAVLVWAWPTARAGEGGVATAPPPGSPARTALLDAVRAALGLDPKASRFKVDHLRLAGTWAYFEGNEVVPLDGREWQETDLTVRALLARGKAGWKVMLIWTLPGDEAFPLRRFERQLAVRRDRDNIPRSLFP